MAAKTIQTEHEDTGHAATDEVPQIQTDQTVQRQNALRVIRVNDPKKFCTVCNWRHRVLARWEGLDVDEDDSDEEHGEWEWLSPPRAAVLEALHRKPPSVWMQILNTQRLCAGAFTDMGIPGMQQTYFRIPLRNMTPISQEALRDSRHSYLMRCHDPVAWSVFHHESVSGGETIKAVYHFTKLTSLVGPTQYMEEGQGILNDGGLRYGRCTHGSNAGVNFHSCFNYCMLTPGYVALELEAVDATHLKKGMLCRYCVNGPAPHLSCKVEVQALIFLTADLPELVLMT